MTIAYPDIDPVAIALGPLQILGHTLGPVGIRWYALAYITGLLLGRYYVGRLVRKPPHAMTDIQVDDFLLWATLGVILGGRLGYVLFYKPSYYLANPSEILAMWHGGMSFHGGALGVITAILLFSRRHRLNLFAVGDVICCAVPIGLFFGRIANFVNGELFGRVAPDVPWAMVFPGGGPEPRHPSQLYEASLEGLVLGLTLYVLWRIPGLRQRTGIISGAFLAGYGVARSICETFRQPDGFLGFLAWDWLTMGQVLSLPLILVGSAMIWWRLKQQPRIV